MRGAALALDAFCYSSAPISIASFDMPGKFDFQRMRAYQLSVSFYGEALEVVRRLRWPERQLADQLIRASSSITLNIAEGAGEYSVPEKLRFYRIARRSAWECAAILELLRSGATRRSDFVDRQMRALAEISSLLTAMILKRSPSPP